MTEVVEYYFKGGFFSESVIKKFQSPNLKKKNVPKNYPELEI